MIWGLDTATRCTGITAGTGEGMPAVGAWTYAQCGTDIGALLEAFEKDMDGLAMRLGAYPTHLIFESPILTGRDFAKGGLLKLRKLYSMAGFLELWCKRHRVVCEEASAQALKKRLTGVHTAKKREMVAMCRGLGVRLPAGEAAEDAADSFAAWLVGLTSHGRQHLTKWDQALYSHRGYLA